MLPYHKKFTGQPKQQILLVVLKAVFLGPPVDNLTWHANQFVNAQSIFQSWKLSSKPLMLEGITLCKSLKQIIVEILAIWVPTLSSANGKSCLPDGFSLKNTDFSQKHLCSNPHIIFLFVKFEVFGTNFSYHNQILLKLD